MSQLNGDYRAHNERMTAYLAHVKQLPPQFEKVLVKQISRDSNSHADALDKLPSILAKLWNSATTYLTGTEHKGNEEEH